MTKTKYYYNTKFPATVLSEAYNKLLASHKHRGHFSSLTVGGKEENWDLDNFNEFLAAYPSSESAHFDDILENNGRLILRYNHFETSVVVTSKDRKTINKVFSVFEKNLDKSKIIISKDPVKIFIGHGRDNQWRQLKDELQDKHGFEVVAYEIGPRAGLSVKEVLEKMLTESSFAILVMTGEDVYNDGTVHARENVIHEAGLFQGYLGFRKAILLKEDKVEEFSNIYGLNQIRFPNSHIKEALSDILATIKREMEEQGQ